MGEDGRAAAQERQEAVNRVSIESLTLDVFEATIEGKVFKFRDEVESSKPLVDLGQRALDEGGLGNAGSVLEMLREAEPTRAIMHVAGLLTRSRLAPLFQEDASYLSEVHDHPERFLDRIQSLLRGCFHARLERARSR